MTELYESMEGIIAAFDREEDVSLGAASTRAAFSRAKKRLSDAQERLTTTFDNHSSFVNARIVASRPFEAADRRGKAIAPAADEEELLNSPKLLKRKLPEP